MAITRKATAVLTAGAGVLALTACGASAGGGGAAPSASAAAPTGPGGGIDVRVHADRLTTPTPRAGAGATPAPGARAAACTAPGPLITASDVDAAMGLRALTVTLTNCGTSPLTVRGYPDLRVLDAAGDALRVTVHHGITVTTGLTDPPPATLTLRHGDRAVAILAWRNTVTDATVTATTGAAFAVTPPGGFGPQVVQETVDVGNTGRLDTTSWHRPG
ncbi:DUF4232 domain-containing protein [Streptomyces sp. V4-01]|uniref:DUF4232 domain-containing protein n=1 Tax=Actinacidiphila polyblastidii TaxID=3110430 RepID=A0ABU7P798_9ACTN|nr:DUF4232 domain-containing protein [Streptomyces sp. V4-01]